MDVDKIDEFKSLFEEFKQTEDYNYRKKQFSFVAVAKQIIQETLKNEPLKNEHLTGLIQTLKWETSDENFDRYLELNISNKDIRENISKNAYNIEYSGYTAAGKTAVTSLNKTQLREVKNFLSEAFNITGIEKAKNLTDKFDSLEIPEVKKGVYSPWLHYINPEIFPIINNSHDEFLSWMGINKKYSSCIEAFAKLKEKTNEHQLGILDSFGHNFKSENAAAVINRVAEGLRKKFPRIWRCADSYKWDDLKNSSLLTFNWLDKNIDYKKTDINNLGGKKAIYPWVYELKDRDLIFILGKNYYCGICIAKSEYDFNGPIVELTGIGEKPAIRVQYIHELDSPENHKLKTHNNPTTFAKIDQYNFGLENVIKYLYKKQPAAFAALKKICFGTIKNTLNMNNLYKNIILYGPPGTGKTYNSIDLAVEIAMGTESQSHTENKTNFDKLRNEGQIEFVTFHQNYSYEDFVIGLRPDSENEQLRFVTYKGIFYEMAKRARENYYASIERTSLSKSFDEVFNEIVNPVTLDGKEVSIKMASGISFKITDVTEYAIHFKKPKGESHNTLSIQTLQDIVEDVRKPPRELSAYYNPFAEKIKRLMKPPKGAKSEVLKNFVLVIDEINRANISKVFGELITLIEDDKRLGEENELKISLPNGEKNFSIPPNLYIIGTMNTADKSIALIDIALRRRFEFIGKYPEYKNLASEESELLQKINTTIFEKKKSADYLIGHAYFMKNLPIETVLKNKIIPLLMEYFSGKIDIVSSIFEGTDWNVNFDTSSYDWKINKD